MKFIVCFTIAFCALLSFVSGTSRALDDAGTRSVFAQGVGSRALAMGGAFTAIANDASAPTWNAAGLAMLTRTELQASHASFYGLGFDEQYVLVAVPSWRLGSLGVGFRHFGVGDIELRNDQNQLLGDASRHETEFSVSYGRAFGAVWSVGAVAKLRRLSMGDLSDDGIGLDVGLIGNPAAALGIKSPWSRRLKMGLAIQNVVQPRIRLIDESVPDPTGVRLGSSFLVPISGRRSVLLALDLERARGVDVRLHAGVEAQLHPILALRAGVQRSGITAGTGVRWRDFSLDYSFEENQFESVQRFAFTLHFGATTFERRRAALEAEERALQTRLAEVFEARQAQRIVQLLAQASLEKQNGDVDEALEILATIDVLEPNHAEAGQLEAACLLQKAQDMETRDDLTAAATMYRRVLNLDAQNELAASGLTRTNEESARRAARSREAQRQFAAALDAFAADDLTRARERLRQVLAVNPQDADAVSMFERTERAIERRAVELARQAMRFARTDHLTEAAALLERARELDATAPEVSEALAFLSARRRQAERSAATADEDAAPQHQSVAGTENTTHSSVQSATLSEGRSREIAEYYQRGMTAMKQGRAAEAVQLWELVWTVDPGYKRVQEHLKRYYLTRGLEAFAGRDLEQAVRVWEDALRVAPSDEQAIQYLNKARERLEKTRALRGASQ